MFVRWVTREMFTRRMKQKVKIFSSRRRSVDVGSPTTMGTPITRNRFKETCLQSQSISRIHCHTIINRLEAQLTQCHWIAI